MARDLEVVAGTGMVAAFGAGVFFGSLVGWLAGGSGWLWVLAGLSVLLVLWMIKVRDSG